MREVIYKYNLVLGPQVLRVPAGAWLVDCALDGVGELAAYIQHTPDSRDNLVKRELLVVGTGEDFDPAVWEYIATVRQAPFVWHVLGKA